MLSRFRVRVFHEAHRPGPTSEPGDVAGCVPPPSWSTSEARVKGGPTKFLVPIRPPIRASHSYRKNSGDRGLLSEEQDSRPLRAEELEELAVESRTVLGMWVEWTKRTRPQQVAPLYILRVFCIIDFFLLKGKKLKLVLSWIQTKSKLTTRYFCVSAVRTQVGCAAAVEQYVHCIPLRLIREDFRTVGSHLPRSAQ